MTAVINSQSIDFNNGGTQSFAPGSGANAVMLLYWAFNPGTPQTFTFGGVAPTHTRDFGNAMHAAVWHNPGSGSANLVQAGGGSEYLFGVLVSFSGYPTDVALSAMPANTGSAVGSAYGISTSINIAAASLLLDLVMSIDDLTSGRTSGAGQTALAAGGWAFGSYKSAESNTSMAWSWSDGFTDTIQAVIALPASGGPSGATLTTPTATSITQTTATIGCTTDNATGTLYGVVTTSATPPSEAQIVAGNDHTGSEAAASGTNNSLSVGANPIDVTGLTADTTYYSHFVQDTGSAEYSNVLSSTGWNTLADEPPEQAGIRIQNIQTPDGVAAGNRSPISVAVWYDPEAERGSAADEVIDDGIEVVDSTLEVEVNQPVDTEVLVDIQYMYEGRIWSFRQRIFTIDLNED